jgi:aryl-alcohol dehydrogenase-like predicted oxidoreductase
MQYRLLGKTGIIVSRVCLGAMTFGGATTPPYDKVGGLSLAETERLVGAALDAGINFIDTADVYAAGESETLLGAALQGRRDEVIVATKFHAPMGKGPNDAGQSRLHIMRSIEGSLRRLRTDHIDLKATVQPPMQGFAGGGRAEWQGQDALDGNERETPVFGLGRGFIT